MKGIRLILLLSSAITILFFLFIGTQYAEYQITSQLSPRIGGHIKMESSQEINESFFEAKQTLPTKIQMVKSVRTNSTFLDSQGRTGIVEVIGYEDGYPLLPIGEGISEAFPMNAAVTLEQTQKKYFGSGFVSIGGYQIPLSKSLITNYETGFSFGGDGSVVYLPMSFLKQTGLIGTGSRVRYSITLLLEDVSKIEEIEYKLKNFYGERQVRFERFDEPGSRLSTAIDSLRFFFLILSITFLFLAGSSLLLESLVDYQKEKSVFLIQYLLGVSKKKIGIFWIKKTILISGISGGISGLIVFVLIGLWNQEFFPLEKGVAPFLLLWLILSSLILVLPLREIFQLQSQSRVGEGEKFDLNSKKGLGIFLFLCIAGISIGTLLSDWKTATIGLGLIGVFFGIFSFLLIKFSKGMELSLGKIGVSFLKKEAARIQFRPGSFYGIVLPVASGILISILFTVQFSWQVSDRLQVTETSANFFALNIRKEHLESINLLEEKPKVYEIIRARVLSINGISLREFLGSGEGDGEFTREFNITTQIDGIPPPKVGSVSLDTDFSKRLGVSLGDTLEFQLLGKSFRAKVSELRESELSEGIQPFFYFYVHPDFFGNAPRNYFLATQSKNPESLSQSLYKISPGITSIDVGSAVDLIKKFLNQVNQGIFLFLGLLGAYSIVLFSILGNILQPLQKNRENTQYLLGIKEQERNSIRLYSMSFLLWGIVLVTTLGVILLSIGVFLTTTFLSFKLLLWIIPYFIFILSVYGYFFWRKYRI